ncbi:MAG: hypothetical protein ACO1OO_09615 [Flavisolibacter sp.]
MKQFIPITLDIDHLVGEYPPYEIARFSKDKLIHIVHLLHTIPANNKDLEIFDGYIPIYSKIVKKRIVNYRHYLDYLLRVGVLETDNRYIIGEKSKGCRFASQYETGLKAVSITNAALRRHQQKDSKYSTAMKKSHRHLVKWFNSNLEIDYNLAMDFISTDLHRKLRNPLLRDVDLKSGKTKNPYNQYAASYINIERIADADFQLSVDTNVYRFHSNITNIRSELRNLLTYNGLPLCSIDIKNSQPLLSIVLLLEEFWKGEGVKTTISIHNINHKSTFKQLPIQQYISYIMCLNSPETQSCAELQRYIDLVTQGVFYERLEQVFGEELGSKYADRRAVKTAMFQVLYSDNRFIGTKDAAPKRLFRDLFPPVYKLFAMIKQGDNTKLPRLLQQLESHLMIKQVAKRIAREKPDLPIFTIHDSIATTVGNEVYVQSVIEEELFAAIGYKPILNTEYWQPSAMKFNDKKLFIGEELMAA